MSLPRPVDISRVNFRAYSVNSMLIFPASGLAMEEKASWERSMVAWQPGDGQRSTTLTVTVLPVHGCGTPKFVGPVHVTLYILPQAAPLLYMPSLAAAISVPCSSNPKHADATHMNQTKHDNTKLLGLA